MSPIEMSWLSSPFRSSFSLERDEKKCGNNKCYQHREKTPSVSVYSSIYTLYNTVLFFSMCNVSYGSSFLAITDILGSTTHSTIQEDKLHEVIKIFIIYLLTV